MKKAKLILDDGTVLEGRSFGAEVPAAGEVVFSTAMTGYPESLTDPSFAGQLLVLTYPLIGNYGTPPPDLDAEGIPLFRESPHIHVSALIVSDYSEGYSHWNARGSLGAWLSEEGVPGLTGIDTRALTRRLRERGVMTGRVLVEGAAEVEPVDYESVNYVDRVSVKEPVRYHAGGKAKVVLVDCGVKGSILRNLVARDLEVIRVPWDYDFNTLDFDGLFLANGPGNPQNCAAAIAHIRAFLANPRVRPCMGICMGNQLLALAAGASVYKLKYGHRGFNQPARLAGTDRCFITSQNHGYAVDDKTLPSGWEPLFTNLNDGSNEGIRHREKPWFSAQFHPEAAGGPLDTVFLFDQFAKLLKP